MQKAITIIDISMEDKDVEIILADLQAATQALELVEPVADRDNKTGRFKKGNRANKKGNNQYLKDGKKAIELVQPQLPPVVEIPHQVPSISRTATGQVKKESAGLLTLQQYKHRLKRALKELLPPEELAAIMIDHARQQDDMRLSQEALRDILDRTIGKPVANNLHKLVGKQDYNINITALPAAEQEQFLLLSSKLLEGEMMGDADTESSSNADDTPDNKG